MEAVRGGGPIVLRLAGILPILEGGRRFGTVEEETATGDVFRDEDVPGRVGLVMAPLESAFYQMST